jgi:hypothetical protein
VRTGLKMFVAVLAVVLAVVVVVVVVVIKGPCADVKRQFAYC